jgi:CxxC-x17-CxxC domain-containing protein
MHKAICAGCGKECEVPFKPREGRAVYCKECFSKRRSGGTAKVSGNNIPAEVKPLPEPQAPKKESGKKTKSREKKVSKKSKKRA